MKSFSEPTDSEVDSAVSLLLSSPTHAAYFLDRLENPNWIGPLKSRGFFASPPVPERVEGGVIRYPIWPASKYLARMAAQAPEEVAEILQNIQTKNPSIFRDILTAANRMPAAIAATIAPMVCKAMSEGTHSSRFPGAIDLCVHLANGGHVSAAVDLAEALFLPRLVHGHGRPNHEDEYWNVEGLEKVIPSLATAARGRFLADLCGWLKASIAAKEYYGDHSTADGSDHWRPAIEEHEQNRTYDFAGNLVGLVRQGFEHAIDGRHIELDTALRILAGHEYHVFTRLSVHLLNRFAERDPELAQKTMMDPEMFKASTLWLWHEYAMLMRRRFLILSPDQQATWLGWVDRGPEKEFYWDTRVAGREATEDDRRKWIQSWQAIRLHWIAPHLSGERRALYERVAADWEDPEECDFHNYSPPANIGWRSPISTEELAGLSLAEALDKISAWQQSKPQANVIREGSEGMARAFGQYVGAKAEELSRQAEMLERREPIPIYIYVRTFVEQMAEAVKAGRKIDVAAVLRLCNWVAEQPVAEYGAYIPVDDVLWKLVDQDWQWARYAICRFIRAVCDPTSHGIPSYPMEGNREAIGSLLKPLAEEPATSQLREESREKNLRVYSDSLTAAINTPRGIAVEAIVAYARWVANHMATVAEGRKVVPEGFDDMPEVRERLEWQIKPENASFEAFAIIGAYFDLLHWIDESWVKGNADRIFDLVLIEREPKCAYGWAAWNSFLDWSPPRANYYQILRPQYVYAVKHLAEAVLPPNSGRTPIHRLGEHLVILYGRGDLKANSSNDEPLLFDFLRVADKNVRSQTIAFVGCTLGRSEALPEAIVVRFEKLWDWYWSEFGEKDVAARPVSGLFGSWFTCEQFPVAWRLERLETVVASPQIPDLAQQVVEHLAEIAKAHVEHVGTATRILDRMIRADKEGWRAYAWRDSAIKILGLAMRGDDATKERALKLIDHLGRRGYQKFGELLQHGGDADDAK